MHADSRLSLRSWCAWILCAGSVVQSFYIPGWSIKSYKDKAPIPLYVNKVYSDNTQLQYAYYDLPFVCPPSGRRHADSSLVSGHSISLNLGEVLRGDRIRNSDYELSMGTDQECRFLCRHEVDRRGLQRARELIGKGYVAEWIVDNLPGATTFQTVDKKRKYYAAGFKIGSKAFSSATGQPRYLINNHVTLVVRWRKAPGRDGEVDGRKVIVGFEVYPKSISSGGRNAEGCPDRLRDPDEEGFELRIPSNRTTTVDDEDEDAKYLHSSYVPRNEDEEEDLDDGATLQIPYTYSVYFAEDEKVEWSNRWDLYFVHQERSSTIHWLAILNSLIIAGLLTTVVAVILTRTVRSDIRGYTANKDKDGLMEDGGSALRIKTKMKIKRPSSSGRQQSPRGCRGEPKSGNGLLDEPMGNDMEHDADISSEDETTLEDVTGWKLLHGDVFRAPSYGGLLAPLVGSGIQLVFMAGGLLVLSCLGVLNPSFRGGFVSVGLGLFIFAGMFSGYFSGRIYQTFGGINWRKNALMTALLFPGLFFTLIFILNLFVWAQASSTAIPFSTLLALASLWLFIQLPLVYLGNWFGFNRIGPWTHPTKTHLIPRQIPQQAWYHRPFPSGVMISGLLPFAVIFIELMFVFQSLWQDKSGYYYVFGYLAAVSIILVITVVEVTVVATYLQLCSEVRHPIVCLPHF
ncbi:MAG: hypothetical protein M1823_000905 [Watsoniomyces obsoletus]|nr:MAG: hypothetical protein M1823_000905 [Watsoniomyces obsoletus]